MFSEKKKLKNETEFSAIFNGSCDLTTDYIQIYIYV